jgi:hypothetical protein
MLPSFIAGKVVLEEIYIQYKIVFSLGDYFQVK